MDSLDNINPSISDGGSESPLVSVIVPAYNAEMYLDFCVESVLKQTYFNLEVVLVDDGSTDSTPQLCQKWMERDCRVCVLTKSNGGLPAARNSGLRAARGEWVIFVDSDDTLLPHAIHELIASSKGSDIVSFGWNVVDELGRTVGTRFPSGLTHGDSEDLISEIAKCRLSDYIWSYMYRRSSIIVQTGDMGPFAEGYTLFEDTISLQRLLRERAFRVAFVPQALYQYRITASSMSRKVNSSVAEAGLNAVNELESFDINPKLRNYWYAKLAKMLLFGIEPVVGYNHDERNSILRKRIRKKTFGLLRLGGSRVLTPYEKIQFLLYRIHIYGSVKRFVKRIRRFLPL